MQVLKAGEHKLLLLELDTEFIENIARQAGFEFRLEDESRRMVLDLNAEGRQAPLLLFDAADPANLGWFSRCQFYVDGTSGAVLQTPIQLANQRDRVRPRAAQRRPPADQQGTAVQLPPARKSAPVTEQTVYRGALQFSERAAQHRRGRVRRIGGQTAGRPHRTAGNRIRSHGHFGLIEYADASPEVRAVYDDIMATRNTDWINNFWKALAHDPPTLRRTWESIKQIMAPGALDPLTKEMIYLAVSATNQCAYCIASHTAAARKAGMTRRAVCRTDGGGRHGERNQSPGQRLSGRDRRSL